MLLLLAAVAVAVAIAAAVITDAVVTIAVVGDVATVVGCYYFCSVTVNLCWCY